MRYLGGDNNFIARDILDLEQRILNALKKRPGSSTDNVIIPVSTGTTPLEIQDAGGTRIKFTSTGTIFINPNQVQPAIVLGPNAIDQKVTGLNADKLDGYNEDYFLTSLPTSALRNVIYGPDTVTPLLGLLVYPGTVVNPFLIVDAGLNTLFAVNQNGQVVVSPTTAMPPMVLGGNATGRLVTGLNADLLDGYHASSFALAGAISHTGLIDLDNDDHAQYIYNQPGSNTRNLIQPSDDYIPLTIKSYGAGQSEDHFQVVDATDVPIAGIDANFQVYGYGLNAGGRKVSSVQDPTAAQDAVTINYLTGRYKSYTGSTASGTLLVGNGTSFTGLPIGTSGQILSVTGSTAAWSTPNKDGSIWYGFERRPITATNTGSITGAFTLAVADASLQNTNDADGFTMGRTASDGNVTYMAFQFACPYEIDTSQPVTAHVYVRLNGAGSNQIEIESTIRVINDTNRFKDQGTLCDDAKALDITGYDSDALVIFPLANAIPASTFTTKQELVKGCIFRDATAGNSDDTFTNSCIIVGVMFRYKRL